MTNTFTFKIVVDFPLLKQFIYEILEHNMLNDREVKFSKNDCRICRVVSKHKKNRDYNVLFSRVVKTITFRVKTLFLNTQIWKSISQQKIPKILGLQK